MKIAVGWTELHPDTRTALEAHAELQGHELDIRDCRSRITGYHELLEHHWRAGADFTVIEHDIVINETVMPGFEACPHVWCVHLYELASGFVPGVLGCVRFRSELLLAEADAMTLAGESDSSGVVARAWYRIDVRLDKILRDRDYRPHIHPGRVEHRNERQKLADPDSAYEDALVRHHIEVPRPAPTSPV